MRKYKWQRKNIYATRLDGKWGSDWGRRGPKHYITAWLKVQKEQLPAIRNILKNILNFAETFLKSALFFRGCGLNFSICAFETPSRTLPDIKMYEVLRRFVVVNLFAVASQRRDPVSLKVLLIPRVHKTWNSFQNCLCKVFDRCSLIDKLLAKESQRQCIAMWSEHDLLI